MLNSLPFLSSAGKHKNSPMSRSPDVSPSSFSPAFLTIHKTETGPCVSSLFNFFLATNSRPINAQSCVWFTWSKNRSHATQSQSPVLKLAIVWRFFSEKLLECFLRSCFVRLLLLEKKRLQVSQKKCTHRRCNIISSAVNLDGQRLHLWRSILR